MKPKVFICLVFITAVILAGCDQKQKSPPQTGTLCPPQYLQAPMFVAPPDNAYVNTHTAVLQWSSPPVPYPPSADGTCRPENFRLTLQKGPFFQESYGGQVDGTVFSWETPLLENGAEYRWTVRGVTDNENGPSSGSRKFYVGANCESGVTAPTLLMPFNGATIFGLAPTFMWENTSECIPYPWRIDIAFDPEFTTMILSKTTGSAATSFTIDHNFPNCTRIYWRVAASAGTDLETFSDTWSVRLATEGCEEEPGAGSISGKVWNDICPLPHDISTPGALPAGCNQHTNGAIADGNITPGEPGIGEVIVHVAQGTCADNVPLGVTKTNVDGDYFLPGLVEGTYCLSVDPAENPLWLGTGWWTYPPQAVDQALGTWEVELASDEDRAGVKFGWQFESGGSNPYNYIGGVVFHDYCTIPHGVGYDGDIPGNCQGSQGWVTGNSVLNEGEPGIPDVEVKAYSPLCTSPLSQVTTTDENGFFSFWFEPGITHCVKVESTTSPNKEILQPGVWSISPNKATIDRLFLYNGQSQSDPDFFAFGWDYSNLPFVATEIEVPLLYPKFKIDLEQANCRAGPSSLWQVYAVVKPGMEFEIKGITREQDWFFVTPSEILNRADFPSASFYEGLSCWVHTSHGTVEGDLEGVEVIKAPDYKTPTPTYVPVNCGTYKTDGQCKEHSDVCTWYTIPGTIPLGECRQK